MRKFVFVFGLLILCFLLNASAESKGQSSVVSNSELAYDMDFEVGVYCGEFYLKILKDELTQYEASLCTWSIQTTVMNGEITDWLFPYDASFADEPYRYRTLRFDGYPVWMCSITLYYCGSPVVTKSYDFFANHTFYGPR